jgi:PTS system nitrogen regulatory IIA component
MKVVDFLAPDAVIPALTGKSKAEVLAEMSAFIARRQAGRTSVDARVLQRALEERERLASTAFGDGVAIPHGKLPSIDRLVGALGRSQAGLDFDSFDRKPTYLVFVLVTPVHSAILHLEALRRLSELFHNAAFRQSLCEAPDGASMYRTIVQEDAKE